MNKECYVCGSLATTVEHVPPKCLFPEQKDLKSRCIDLRKNLITVPSCEEHNCRKSGDDEYLLNILSMTFQTGEFGLLNFEGKVMRSWSRKDRISKLKEKLLSTARVIKIRDLESHKIDETLELDVDIARLSEVLKYCALGLYYYEFSEVCNKTINVAPLFAPYSNNKYTKLLDEMERYYDIKFSNVKRKGENPEVFQYAFFKDNINDILVLQMWFYEGCKVISFFK